MGEEAVAAPQRFNLGDVRFYESRFPSVEELVLVRVTRITEMGAYVQLLEYNGLEGMVLMSELSKRRIRSVKKLIRVGRTEIVLVLRVDEQKGYIDLSKRRVSAEEAAKCEERYCKARRAFAVMAHLAQKFRVPVTEINAKIAWPLNKKYGSALDAFRKPDFATRIVDELGLEPTMRDALLADLALRLAAAPMKMRVRVDCWCYGNAGIDAVKAMLLAAKTAAVEAHKKQSDGGDAPAVELKAIDKAADDATEGNREPVQVNMISSPQYVIIVNCADKVSGEEQLNAALKALEKTAAEYRSAGWKQQGEFQVIGGDDQDMFTHDDNNADDDEGGEEQDTSDEEEDEDEDGEDESNEDSSDENGDRSDDGSDNGSDKMQEKKK